MCCCSGSLAAAWTWPVWPINCNTSFTSIPTGTRRSKKITKYTECSVPEAGAVLSLKVPNRKVKVSKQKKSQHVLPVFVPHTIKRAAPGQERCTRMMRAGVVITPQAVHVPICCPGAS